MKPLILKNVKMSYCPITLPRGTTLLVCSPNKRTMDEFKALRSDEAEDADIYAMLSRVLSDNKQGIKVTVKELEGLRSEHIIAIFRQYEEFLNEIANQKN